jgi:hypothetical protein
MGLRSTFQRVLDRFSGEYSAKQGDIRPDDGAKPGVAGDVKITRARLHRPAEAAKPAGVNAVKATTSAAPDSE